MPNPLPSLVDIEALDHADALGAMRDRFALPDGVIYLDGNSLGPASKSAFAELELAARQEWAEGLIRSWNSANWFDLPLALGERVGRLIGAGAGETVVCDSTSINIYKALHAALALRPNRSVIVAEGDSFPTDLYMLEGVASTRPDITIRLEGVDGPNLEDLIDQSVAAVLVNQVNYKTGQLRDMAALTSKAHASGAVVIWDLCHSAGAMPVDLNLSQADLAVGCTYKYLNGGPGAPAFIFAATRHHDHLSQPLSGWWSHARPFAFSPTFEASKGIRRFLCGTQPILSLRALKGALDDWDDVDLALLRAKSMALGDLFIALVEAKCAGYGLTLASPRDAKQRGSQVSFSHADGYAVMQALIARGVIGDYRAPNLMRFGFAPLYIHYRDVWNAVEVLSEILASETWRDPIFAQRAGVT